MADQLSEGHYVLGIEGLALLRAGAELRFDGIEDRVREIAELVGRLDEPPYSARRDLPVYDVAAGYAGWAPTYDDGGNETIELEETAVRRLLDELRRGVVLDAACGTGRHAQYLAAAGHEVIGVDASEEMLERARTKLPGADLRSGDLTALPLEDESVDSVVCGLALSHVEDMRPAVAELGRVLRPGGRIVISNPHPLAIGLLGWRAVFVDVEGRRSMIREYPHLAGDYLEAFAAANLVAPRCVEPRLTRDQAAQRAKGDHADAFADVLTGLPAVIVWEAERA